MFHANGASLQGRILADRRQGVCAQVNKTTFFIHAGRLPLNRCYHDTLQFTVYILLKAIHPMVSLVAVVGGMIGGKHFTRNLVAFRDVAMG